MEPSMVAVMATIDSASRTDQTTNHTTDKGRDDQDIDPRAIRLPTRKKMTVVTAVLMHRPKDTSKKALHQVSRQSDIIWKVKHQVLGHCMSRTLLQ